MAELTFETMTWPLLREKHGIQVQGAPNLLGGRPPVEPSAILTGQLKRARHARLPNERARAYRFIDPVLSEIEELRRGKIVTLPEIPIEVVGAEGLRGIPDFILSAGPSYEVVPIVSIVEAKQENIETGLAPCAAELYAAHLLNHSKMPKVYGCVTTGIEWRFLCLDGNAKIAHVDDEVYLVSEIDRLLGAFCSIIDESLAALGL
ncbi:MAG: hypothetical protein U0359_13070 [Byssovorax sp.]